MHAQWRALFVDILSHWVIINNYAWPSIFILTAIICYTVVKAYVIIWPFLTTNYSLFIRYNNKSILTDIGVTKLTK